MSSVFEGHPCEISPRKTARKALIPNSIERYHEEKSHMVFRSSALEGGMGRTRFGPHSLAWWSLKDSFFATKTARYQSDTGITFRTVSSVNKCFTINNYSAYETLIYVIFTLLAHATAVIGHFSILIAISVFF